MPPRIRLILRVVFIGFFVLSAPVVILYSAGYRYHAAKRRIEKTGIILIETVPSNATVSLNGTVQRRTTPVTLQRLLPEDYDVRIEKEGRVPWTGMVTVRSGETAFLVGIRLLQDALPKLVSEGAITNAVWHDASGRAAFAREGERGTEIVLRDEDGTETLAARFAAGTYGGITLSWSPNGRSLLAAATLESGATHAYLLSIADGGVASRSLHDAFPAGPLIARWTPEGDVAVTATDGVHRVPISGDPTAISADRTIVDAVTDGRAWYGLLRGQGRTTLSRIDQGRALGPLPDGDWRFVDGGTDPMIAVDERREKIAILDADGLAPATYDALRIERPRTGRILLLWNDFEIALLDLETGERRTVTRVGSTVQDATRLEDGRIVFSTRGGIFLLEPQETEYRPAVDVVRFSDIGPIHVTEDSALLRFAGTVGNMRGLYEREL